MDVIINRAILPCQECKAKEERITRFNAELHDAIKIISARNKEIDELAATLSAIRSLLSKEYPDGGEWLKREIEKLLV